MPLTQPPTSSSSSQPKKKVKLTPAPKSIGKIKTVKLDSIDPSSSTSGSSAKKLNPLTAFAKSSVFDVGGLSPSQGKGKGATMKTKTNGNGNGVRKKDVKGKRKADDQGPNGVSQNDKLWVDLYEPTTEEELAVHKKKVEDVRRWFVEALEGGPSGKLRKYRRILALTGPAGTGKTATVRVLARELGFEIVEWRNSMSDKFADVPGDDDDDEGYGGYRKRGPSDQEALFTKFQAFLTRASSCQSIFSAAGPVAQQQRQSTSSSSPSQSTKSHSTSSTSTPKPKSKGHIILLEDLPNILHPHTQSQFHTSLQALVGSPITTTTIVPVVIIVSDAGVRGEVGDERMAAGGWGGGKDVVDIRSVLPGELLGSAYVTQIGFNPIAPTLLRKALQTLLSFHFSSPFASSSSQQKQRQKQRPPRQDVLDIIVESSNGDIRSAIMALQFACIVELPRTRGSGSTVDKGKGQGPGKGKGKKIKAGEARGGDDGVEIEVERRGGSARVILEAVTRRESSLALFHLMGKVLYNKRKGDPPNTSASAKDIQREKDIDAALEDPPPLPPYMGDHERRTSRVDVDTIYADSPIDSSLFSLYVQQNYTQFCNEVEECEGVSEWLSWVDSSGGEAWHQANPYQFHLLTLGTLHSLPSPVARRSQKFFKPEFFEILKREREAADAVGDVRRWLADHGMPVDLGGGGGRAGGWSRGEVVMELGGVLKARDRLGSSSQGSLNPNIPSPPSAHRLFSSLTFASTSSGSGVLLGEKDDGDAMAVDGLDEEAGLGVGCGREDNMSAGAKGGWLESDDIEEF